MENDPTAAGRSIKIMMLCSGLLVLEVLNMRNRFISSVMYLTNSEKINVLLNFCSDDVALHQRLQNENVYIG